MESKLQAMFFNGNLIIENEKKETVLGMSRRGPWSIHLDYRGATHQVKYLFEAMYDFLYHILKTARIVRGKGASCNGFSLFNPPLTGSEDSLVYLDTIFFEEKPWIETRFGTRFYDVEKREKDEVKYLIKKMLTENEITVYGEDVEYVVKGEVLKAISNDGDEVLVVTPDGYKLNYPFFIAKNVNLNFLLTWFENIFTKSTREPKIEKGEFYFIATVGEAKFIYYKERSDGYFSYTTKELNSLEIEVSPKYWKFWSKTLQICGDLEEKMFWETFRNVRDHFWNQIVAPKK